MLKQLLNDDSVLVRIGVATAVTFIPLYILQSMGYKWAYQVSILVFLGILVTNVGRDFTGGSWKAR